MSKPGGISLRKKRKIESIDDDNMFKSSDLNNDNSPPKKRLKLSSNIRPKNDDDAIKMKVIDRNQEYNYALVNFIDYGLDNIPVYLTTEQLHFCVNIDHKFVDNNDNKTDLIGTKSNNNDCDNNKNNAHAMDITKIKLKDVDVKAPDVETLLSILKILIDKQGFGFYGNVTRKIQAAANDKYGEYDEYYMLIGKRNNKIVCFAVIRETDKEVAIDMLESFDRGNGFGSYMVKKIISDTTKAICAAGVLVQSKEFWKKMGFQPNVKNVNWFIFQAVSTGDDGVSEHWMCGMMKWDEKIQQKYINENWKSNPSDVCLYSNSREQLKVVTKEVYDKQWNKILHSKQVSYDYVAD